MPALLGLKLDKLFYPSMVKDAARFQALSNDQSDWRAARASRTFKHSDLFAALMEACDPDTGRKYSQADLVAEAGLLIIAGSDTAATGLTSCLFYLLHYPETLTRLECEVRSIFANWEDIRSGDLLSSCTYLTACLDESMRMTPPVGAILPREILHGGMMIEGQYVPAGIDVGVPHYALHHNSEYYLDPFTFRPERWIVQDDVSTSDVALAQSAFCAFGVGRTSCIGCTLAYLEMSILLARVVWLYDMRLERGSVLGEGSPNSGEDRHRVKEFQTYDCFTSVHQGPMVEFRRAKRQSSPMYL